jgi:hypothetical protein
VYILFNAKHGLNASDKGMLAHLSSLLLTPRGTQPWTLQSIITKADTIPLANISTVINSIRKEIHEAAPLCLPPIVTSTEMRPPFGIDEVRDNIIDACGIGKAIFWWVKDVLLSSESQANSLASINDRNRLPHPHSSAFLHSIVPVFVPLPSS